MGSKPIKKLSLQTDNVFRKLMLKIMQYRHFDLVISIFIVLNALVHTIQWYRQPDVLNRAQDLLRDVFIGIFSVEVLIKISALGMAYFGQNWNIFDFTIVILSIIAILIELFTSFSLGGATTIIRLMRMLRILRLWKGA